MAENLTRNLVSMFFDQADRLGDKPFLWSKRDGQYVARSWRETAAEVSALARGLENLGITAGDRVMLTSENRPEWAIAELGITACGAIAVPTYTTNTVADYRHVLQDSGAKAAIVSTKALAERVLPAAHQSNMVQHLISLEALDQAQSVGPNVVDWDAVLAQGRTREDDIAKRANDIDGGDTSVIIYTSGTGGVPKGVMLDHNALLHNCRAAQDAIAVLGLDDEIFLSFLPLSHSYEHLTGQFFPIYIGAQIYYAEGIEHLGRNMKEARPTIMTAVPRLYELMHGRISKDIEKSGGLKEKLFNKAVELGRKKFEAPGSLSLGEKITDVIVDKLVRDKVRGNFGGRLKALISGGAPLNADIGMFFTALGLRLLQGYGQTESAPLISVNRPSQIKLHTVGPPALDVEVKIADDGEILARGDMVMQGYWQNPDATAEVIKDGWLHTGDVGRLDADGHIEITDRKKDIIVNSGGDTLSPQRVEGFLTLEPEIAQAMVFGDKRPHLVALIVPDKAFVAEWSTETGSSPNLDDVVGNEEFHRVVSAAVDRVNAQLAAVERIRRFKLIGDEFTIDNEMMTPSLKVRRHKVVESYGEALEGLYQ